MARLYTMSTATPGAWQQLLELLQENPELSVHDLRPLGEPLDRDVTQEWRNVALHLPTHRYTWHGLFLPGYSQLPILHLASRLRSGESVVCFDQKPLADGSLREEITWQVMQRVPGTIHEELAWQNTPLGAEPKLVRFLCSVYGHLQDMGRVEVEVEQLSGGIQGTPHNEATEVRVYGMDGTQRLPDFTLPYWQTILDSYPLLFAGDTTKEDRLKTVQDLLVYEREYLESGLDWPAIGSLYTSPMVFDLSF